MKKFTHIADVTTITSAEELGKYSNHRKRTKTNKKGAD